MTGKPRCTRCFKAKELVPPAVGLPEMVCKACSYEIDQVIGYLEFIGASIQFQMLLTEQPPKPPKKQAKNGRQSIADLMKVPEQVATP